jgi:hypothetical protein
LENEQCIRAFWMQRRGAIIKEVVAKAHTVSGQGKKGKTLGSSERAPARARWLSSTVLSVRSRKGW